MSRDDDPAANSDGESHDRVVDSYSTTVTGGARELAVTRQFVRACLTDLPKDVVPDAVLVTDALITEVLRSHDSAQVVLRIRSIARGHYLQIETTPLDTRTPTAGESDNIRALVRTIIEQLAIDWGVEGTGGTVTTWADLDIPAQPAIQRP
ncbi:hypothetical protein FB384_004223 [Prauserella sediminis]|uniref:Histidine kinase-like protein n=1 Tax=Prauserella sediminis TaxID=577680 RepID=A0A839XPV8_9PSEU|nr:hypothetical protein [Prauserella sediminis]MBB3665270.1 hypothetical protein [Prauserella sediminis]